jgi:hypothetical protein
MKSQIKGNGKYLYAIVTDRGESSYGDIGIDGNKVYSLPDGKVAAVVSDMANGRIRPERRNIAAHQGVLKCLMGKGATPLPLSFGMIAESPQAIKKSLLKNRKAFLDQLQRVDGKVEMGLRVTWDVPNIFEYFVNTHAELRAARDTFLGTHREPTQEDKIEVGRMFDRLLKEDREEYASKVEDVLLSSCFEIKRNPSKNEREVMNLACLVGRQESQTTFEAAIFEAARMFDNNFTFDFNGPWAPHNFVDIELAS